MRENKEDVCEYSLTDSLSDLGLTQWEHQLTKPQFAEQILMAVLDEKFVRYLRECEPSLSALDVTISESDIGNLLNYVIKDLGCTELLAAAGVWRKDRVSKPALLYPKILQTLNGSHTSARLVSTANPSTHVVVNLHYQK